MTQIVLETRIAASPERCFDLCRTVEVHLSVPGARETAVDGVKTGPMQLGDHVTWRSTRFRIPVRMTSKITEFERPSRFVDEMQRGPFRRWRHVHRFERTPDGTLMVDEIDFASPLGPLGWLADVVFVRRYMTGLVGRQNEHIRGLAEGRQLERRRAFNEMSERKRSPYEDHT